MTEIQEDQQKDLAHQSMEALDFFNENDDKEGSSSSLSIQLEVDGINLEPEPMDAA